MRKVGVMLQKYIDKYPVPQESVLLCPLGEGGWSVEDFGGDHMGLRRSGGASVNLLPMKGRGGHTEPGWGGEGGSGQFYRDTANVLQTLFPLPSLRQMMTSPLDFTDLKCSK